MLTPNVFLPAAQIRRNSLREFPTATTCFISTAHLEQISQSVCKLALNSPLVASLSSLYLPPARVYFDASRERIVKPQPIKPGKCKTFLIGDRCLLIDDLKRRNSSFLATVLRRSHMQVESTVRPTVLSTTPQFVANSNIVYLGRLLIRKRRTPARVATTGVPEIGVNERQTMVWTQDQQSFPVF